MGLAGALGGSSLGGVLLGEGVHKFDTGLFRAQRSVVRQAIADMLKPLLLPALGGSTAGYVRSIRVLPRPIRGDSDEELGWIGNAVQGQAPCICIALGNKSYTPEGMSSVDWGGKLEIAIYAVSSNFRGFVDGRLSEDVVGAASAQSDPGIETMLEHIEERLIGQDPNIEGLHELDPQSEDEVFTGGQESVWEQKYSMRVERVVNPDRDAGLVMTIESQTNIDGADPALPVVDTVTTLEIP